MHANSYKKRPRIVVHCTIPFWCTHTYAFSTGAAAATWQLSLPLGTTRPRVALLPSAGYYTMCTQLAITAYAHLENSDVVRTGLELETSYRNNRFCPQPRKPRYPLMRRATTASQYTTILSGVHADSHKKRPRIVVYCTTPF